MRFPWESLTCVISFYISYMYLFILWLNIMSFLWSLVQPLYICYPLYSELLLKTHMYKWMQTLYSFTFEKFVMITISFWSLGGQMLLFFINVFYSSLNLSIGENTHDHNMFLSFLSFTCWSTKQNRVLWLNFKI